MTPDWRDSPEWAAYVAQNIVGDWHWCEDRPKLRQGIWTTDKQKQHAGYSGRMGTKARKPFRLPIEPRPQTTKPAEAGSEGQGA